MIPDWNGTHDDVRVSAREHFETITFKFEELVKEIQVDLRSKKRVVTLMNDTMPLDPAWLTVKLQVVRTRGKCYTLTPAKGTKNKIPSKMRIIGSAYLHKNCSKAPGNCGNIFFFQT